MDYNFDENVIADRDNFVRSNPVFLKAIFGRVDVLPFWVADTDFQVMPALKKALAARVETGLFGYETKSPALKKSLSKWYDKRYQIKIKANRLLFMTSVNTSLAALIDEFSSPGDGIIIQPPVFSLFRTIIDSLGRKVINNPLRLAEDRYEFDFADLELKVQDPVNKMLILCSPQNPVGRVWTSNELTKLAQICVENDVLLVTDEIHGDVVYSPNKYVGMLSIYHQFSDHIVMVSSAGKSFGMPGLVDSFIFTPNNAYYEKIKERIERFHLDKSNAFANIAWEAAYTNGEVWLQEMTNYLRGNIDYIAEFLKQNIPIIGLTKPEGTYQVWLDFRKLELTDEELSTFLARDASLALNSGTSYGPGGEGFMRMNIGSTRSTIEQAMQQLKVAVDNLK
jgi:cysteine-S-conjugate beta-lyase